MTTNSMIFTRITNEVRDDNLTLTQVYRREHKVADLGRHLRTKLMSTYAAEKSVMDEVDSILFQRSLRGSSSIDGGNSYGSWQSTASRANGRSSSPSGRSLGSREEKLRKRAGEMKQVTERWCKGPVAIGQVRIS